MGTVLAFLRYWSRSRMPPTKMSLSAPIALVATVGFLFAWWNTGAVNYLIAAVVGGLASVWTLYFWWHLRKVYGALALIEEEAGEEQTASPAVPAEPLPDTCARCGDLVDPSNALSGDALLPDGREYCHACLLAAGKKACMDPASAEEFPAWIRENPEPSALLYPGFWLSMRSLGRSVPGILLVGVALPSMGVVVWGLLAGASLRILVFLLPVVCIVLGTVCVWLVLRENRIRLAHGELRVQRLLGSMELAIPLAQLKFAARRPGWITLLHQGARRDIPLLFQEGPYFAAALQLMSGAELR